MPADLLECPENEPKLLSIVVPLYNEALGLQGFYSKLIQVLDRLPLPAEVWLVNDGSVDATDQIARGIAEADRRVGLVTLSRNFGHQMALTAGLDHARGDVVVCMDGDGQHPPELIPQMLAAHGQGFDIVLARRRNPGGTLFKRLTSALFYRVINSLSETSLIPGAADFRLMSRSAVDALRSTREYHRFLRGLVQWIGFRSTVLDYDPPPRIAGETKYTFRRMRKFAADGILSFSTVPLRLSIYLGFLLILLASAELLHTAWLIVSGRQDELVPGWTSLIFSVLGIGGVQLMMLGVIGQYIGMIFEQVKGRPLYLLRTPVVYPAHSGARNAVLVNDSQ